VIRALSAFLLLLCAPLCAPLPASADAADLLFIRPWVELEPMVRIDPEEYPIPLDTAAKKLLEEARLLFSGMIYGWSFSYVPGDLARRVEESFVLAPLAEIPTGSSRLLVRETEVAEGKLWARISYALNGDESMRRRAWESNTALQSTGQGGADVILGPAAKRASLDDAIRDAIRRSLDTRYLNKPREIKGEVVLWEDPQAVVRSGRYRTSAKVKLIVRDLVPYRIF
jgi:hypothetical protein